MTGKTAVEAWRQMYHELKEASESRDGAYEKVIKELREELFHRTADLETAQAQLDAVRPYLQHKEHCNGYPALNEREVARNCDCGLQQALEQK